MTISLALQEAYASGDEVGVVLSTAEIDHGSFPEPIRVVTGLDDGGDPDVRVNLPLVEGGPRIPHTPCGFTLVRPGFDENGPTDAKVSIDNVSDLLNEHFEAAVGFNLPIRITFRQYRVFPGLLPSVTGPDEVIEGMILKAVDLYADRAEGTISWPDGRDALVPTGPDAFFDSETYPGLFGQ